MDREQFIIEKLAHYAKNLRNRYPKMAIARKQFAAEPDSSWNRYYLKHCSQSVRYWHNRVQETRAELAAYRASK